MLDFSYISLPPFSKEKEPLKSNEETDKDNEVANEDTPMIQSLG